LAADLSAFAEAVLFLTAFLTHESIDDQFRRIR